MKLTVGARVMPSLKQVFMSHSKKDALVKQVFNELLKETDVKPIWMEYEKSSQRANESNWHWISKYIRMPNTIAVFVLLTRNVLDIDCPKRTVPTQNWVSYEIGVASAFSKLLFVIKEETVDFPVPYLTNYMPYSLTKTLTAHEREFWDPETARIIKSHYARTTRLILEDLKMGRNFSKTPLYRCDNCLTSFYYHGTNRSFKCPCCSKQITEANCQT